MSTKGAEKEPICHIHCDVENCIHNNHQCGCTANEIKVGPTFATTCNDTVCQSFKDQKAK